MKIYTKTGDKGKTSLIGGTRVSKADLRLETYGTADELNSFIGLLRAENLPEEDDCILRHVQNKLFNLGGFLATDTSVTQTSEATEIAPQDVTLLETAIDRDEEGLPPVRGFILPAGDRAISTCHVCRTVTRRLERRMVELFALENEQENEQSAKAKICLQYVNRLSDYLFILSKKLAKIREIELFLWEK